MPVSSLYVDHDVCYSTRMRTTITMTTSMRRFDGRPSISKDLERCYQRTAAESQADDRAPARRRLGQLRDSITIPDDFDETPAEIMRALDEPL